MKHNTKCVIGLIIFLMVVAVVFLWAGNIDAALMLRR